MRLFLLLLLQSTVFAANWPAWRGPLGTGITTETNLPLKWSTTENVKWRVPLPEPGNSSPIVWGDRIFLTQAIGDRRNLRCLSRQRGDVLWEQGVATSDKETTHQTNPYCSSSPVTDGERVIAWFASDGLFCYDLSGKQLWSRTNLGRQVHIWGAGASPIIHGDVCFLNFGPGETTYLLAVNKHTGRTIWKHDEDTGYGRPRPTNSTSSESQKSPTTFIGSWATPVVMKVEGAEQLLMPWPDRLAAYALNTGKELWTCAGLDALVYTSPVYQDGIVVVMGGFNRSVMAVQAGGAGDITASRRLWRFPRSPQRVGSGVIYQGHIYVHNEPGTAMCLELKTGDVKWEERLTGKSATGQNWSSIMLSGDRCYTITQGGDCFVFRASPQFELLAMNSLGERSNSSLAPSNRELFIRTHQALWCIAQPVPR